MPTRLTKDLSRRDFIKFSALASAGMLIDFRMGNETNSLKQFEQSKTGLLGRVFNDATSSFNDPSIKAQQIAIHKHNDILSLKDTVIKKFDNAINEIWYRLDDNSFIHSRDVQPVVNQLNTPQTDVKSSGLLAEVTVPFTDAWNSSTNGNTANQIFFFGSTHWVYGLGEDDKKNIFYLVKEDRWNYAFYVDATHMRIVQDEELLPLSEQIPLKDKQIRISLQQQVMIAYEKNEPVFMSPLASGQLTGSADLTTPPGNFVVTYKRPSRHMAHSDRMGSNGVELYGVPWVSYFTDSGIAFHGTYWHNNFTQPRSHGCINLPISAAHWVYRWTQPVVPPREQKFVSRLGTSVEVF
jgi:lipoprotein-anchoring transpeptidase ErfK/SrfK